MAGKKKKRYDTKTVIGFMDLYKRDYTNMQYVKPGFPKGTVGGLVAAGASGKTYKALQDGVTIASGIGENNGIPMGPVLYLPAEDPIDEVGKRVKVIADDMKLNEKQMENCAKNFKIWSLLGESPDLLETIETDDSRPLIDAICEIAASFDTPTRLIIFDTLRRFTYCDENDAGAMSKFLSCMEVICKRVGCSCLYLHHATKSAAMNGQLAMQQAARGSSVLSDNIRYQEYLAPMEDADAEKLGELGPGGTPPKVAIGTSNRGQYVRWGVSKQNYGFPVKPIWLKRNKHGVLMPIALGPIPKNSGRGRNDAL